MICTTPQAPCPPAAVVLADSLPDQVPIQSLRYATHQYICQYMPSGCGPRQATATPVIAGSRRHGGALVSGPPHRVRQWPCSHPERAHRPSSCMVASENACVAPLSVRGQRSRVPRTDINAPRSSPSSTHRIVPPMTPLCGAHASAPIGPRPTVTFTSAVCIVYLCIIITAYGVRRPLVTPMYRRPGSISIGVIPSAVRAVRTVLCSPRWPRRRAVAPRLSAAGGYA